MSHYKPYPVYKDSGVEWLGKVPEHWSVKPLKWFGTYQNSNVDKKIYEGQTTVRLCNYTDVYHNEFIKDSPDFMMATASDSEIQSMSLKMLDIIITKDSEDPTDIGIPAIVAEDLKNIVCGYHLTIIRAPEKYARFVHRLIQSNPTKARFYVESPGITRYGLNQNAIGGLPILLPPPDEAMRLANFIDTETARIDALISKKTRFIELLREKRQALITQAVTQGLGPSVKLKDSGVEWLGDVPEHWDVKRLKFIATVQTGVAKGKDTTGEKTIEVRYLRVANVQDGYLDLSEVATIEIVASDLPRYLLQSGDVLMNEGGDFDKLGRGHVWNGEIDSCIHQNHVFAVRPYGVSSRWLNTFTSSTAAQFYFMGRSKQSTNLASISSSNLMELVVPLPPDAEQGAILDQLSSVLIRVDASLQKTQRSIEFLKERRSALITAAVTGQIDLREAA